MRRSSDSSFFFFYKLWWWHATKLLQKNVTEQWTFSSQLNKGQMTDQAIISFAEAMITNQQTISTRAQAQSCKECGKYKNIHDIFFSGLFLYTFCVWLHASSSPQSEILLSQTCSKMKHSSEGRLKSRKSSPALGSQNGLKQ